jgi:hypothetical protein
MKNIFKYSLALLTVILGFVSCDSERDDNYQPASISGKQVFFANGLPTKYEISPDANSFSVSISRGDTVGALTVPLNVTLGEGSIFTVPSSVTFAAGEKNAPIVISYDPAKIVYGDYTSVKIDIADASMTTLYGLSSYQFTAGVTAWVDFGKGFYREDIISTWYNLGHPVYEVTIQKNTVKNGLYRIVNPYGKNYGNAISEALGGDDWANYYDYDNDYFMEINASNPEAVYIVGDKTGATVDPASGMISYTSMVDYYLSKGKTVDEIKASNPEYFGTLKDGLITMPANSMLISEENYNSGSWYIAAKNGLFTVALPGSVIADYSLDVEYVGRYTSAENVDYARFNFTFGDDVETVKYALVSANDDIDATAAGIQDGSIEADVISASGTTEIVYGESGKYNLVAVIYAGGEAVAVEAFSFKLQSSGDTAETWTAAFIGTYVYGAKSYSQDGSLFYDQTYTDQGLTLYQSDSNPNRYRIAPLWENNEVGLVFEMDEDGIITVDGVETGTVDETYGMIYVTDFKTGEIADMPSFYNEGVFYFNLSYHIASGPGDAFAFVQDTFTLTGTAQAAMKKAMKKFTVKNAAKRSSKRSIAKKTIAKHIVKLNREKASLR